MLLANFEGKEFEMEMLRHVEVKKPFLAADTFSTNYIVKWILDYTLEKGHSSLDYSNATIFAITYALLTNGQVGALDQHFCPWCSITKGISHDIIILILIVHKDTIQSVLKHCCEVLEGFVYNMQYTYHILFRFVIFEYQ